MPKMTEKQFEKISDQERYNRTLTGTLYYSSVHEPDMSPTKKTEKKKWVGDPVFKTTVGLDKENVKLAESYGLQVQEPNDSIPEPHVSIKRKVKQGKTAEDVKPDVVDSMQNPIPPHILIGNGSKGTVKFGTYWYDNNGGGVGTTFFKMQVTELVAYSPEEDGFVKDESGFTVDSVTPANTSNESPFKEDDIPDFDAPKKASSGSSIFDD